MTTYPVPSFPRFHLANDDAVYASFHTYTSDFVTTRLYSNTLNLLDKDLFSGTSTTIPLDGGLILQFVSPVTIQAYLMDLSAGVAPEIHYTTDTVPDLASGTWLPVGTATLTPVGSYRTPAALTPALVNITALRFQFTGTAEIGNLHLYGYRGDKLFDFVEADGVTPVTYMDFGTGGKDGWQDFTFRILNKAQNEISVSVDFVVPSDSTSGTLIADEVFFSSDGLKFYALPKANQSIEGIPVGGMSQLLTVRRNSPTDHDNSRGYSAAALFSAWSDYDPDIHQQTSFRVYVGDVDPSVPQPQLWGATPVESVPGGTVTVVAAGAGDTQGEFSSQLYLVSAGQPVIPMTSVLSWTTEAPAPALAPNVAKADFVDHRAGVYEPKHVVIQAVVPSTAPPGFYSLHLMSTSSGVSGLSNAAAVRVTSAPSTIPSPQDGIRLQATSLAGVILASNVPYQSLAFTDELSDVGAGKVTLDFSSPFWSELPTTTITPQFIAENEFVWQVWEGSALRFSFLNSIADDSVINQELNRVQAIQGEGIGNILTWSVVAPPKFPAVPPYYWSFANARLWQWLTIWAECQLRTPTGSAQRRFLPTFTRYSDSAGNVWLDPGFENQQKNGVNMLTLLNEHCDSVGADYHIDPDFKINVIYSRSTVDVPGKYFGIDRDQVVFRSALVNDKRILRDRSEVGNWVISQDDYGEVTLKYNAASIAKNGMRERYVEAGRSGTLTTRESKASEELKWHQDQIVSWSLSVDPYYVDYTGTIFNRVFVDYKVGDWIYLDVEGVSSLVSVQVSAITMSVDSDGSTRVELTLESLASLRKRKAELKDSVTSGGGSGPGGASLVLFEEEIFPISDASPDTTYDIKYLPLPKSEIITLGMKKYMEVDGTGALAAREFTRTLRRGEHWERTGWTVTITDPTVFDEAY